MAEMKDAHVVEIPVDEEHQQKVLCCMNTTTAIQHHPLMEISQSPGHLLLLKLWQREEDLFGRRISLKESRMDSSKREIFQLCCFFLVFHGFFLTLLFTSSVSPKYEHTCRKWWIPSILSLSTSLVFVFLVQFKLYRYWKVCRQLQREKNDNRALTRCIQELRMKGASFDLSKEPLSGKRMKSSSVEIKWKPLTWCSQNVITICLLCFSDSAFPPLKLKRDSRKTKAFKLRHCEAISLCLRQSRSAPMREAVSLPISYLVPSIMNYEVV
ncbi:hypothetical protein KPL71_002154 [Citrus sinensis]|uniref:Uncharacterized protein n=1 Tax=Citrus sinensis TaxID=2711 RepID=A0ACB8P3L8_CITSI|nr:hypothetical protein KPL71_002154 [Citrus sinensis]